MSRLWDKGQAVDDAVHRFTVGDDPQCDRRLAAFDCVASAAHARMLRRVGALSAADCNALLTALRGLHAEAAAGTFDIPAELEDCHTAIESRLVAALGATGERIHAGRSRNDQVATAMRLFLRDRVLAWLVLVDDALAGLRRRIDADGATPLPGYTHLRPAMPSSVGMWLFAWAEGLLEQMQAALDVLDRLDTCPAWTGAGFGVPLPFDRAAGARLLGFSRAQRSPIDVQNSRGRMELRVARLAGDMGAVLEKFAWDVALFSGPEFGFFALPDALTTGSSIMPQKKNPDALELLRGRAGGLRGRAAQIEWVAGKLPSSYHRDLQLTKEPVMRAADDIEAMLAVFSRVVDGLTIRPERAQAAMCDELYAAHAATARVAAGVPFRQAYREVAAQIAQGKFVAPAALRAGARVEPAMLAEFDAERAAVGAAAEATRVRVNAALRNVWEMNIDIEQTA